MKQDKLIKLAEMCYGYSIPMMVERCTNNTINIVMKNIKEASVMPEGMTDAETKTWKIIDGLLPDIDDVKENLNKIFGSYTIVSSVANMKGDKLRLIINIKK